MPPIAQFLQTAYTDRVIKALKIAEEKRQLDGLNYIGVEHVLAGLCAVIPEKQFEVMLEEIRRELTAL